MYCFSSPFFRLSDHRLKMLPLRATSGVSGVAGSVAVDEKMIVSAFRNFAAASSCVPKVSCVFLPSASRRNSFCDPLMRAM